MLNHRSVGRRRSGQQSRNLTSSEGTDRRLHRWASSPSPSPTTIESPRPSRSASPESSSSLCSSSSSSASSLSWSLSNGMCSTGSTASMTSTSSASVPRTVQHLLTSVSESALATSTSYYDSNNVIRSSNDDINYRYNNCGDDSNDDGAAVVVVLPTVSKRKRPSQRQLNMNDLDDGVEESKSSSSSSSSQPVLLTTSLTNHAIQLWTRITLMTTRNMNMNLNMNGGATTSSIKAVRPSRLKHPRILLTYLRGIVMRGHRTTNRVNLVVVAVCCFVLAMNNMWTSTSSRHDSQYHFLYGMNYGNFSPATGDNAVDGDGYNRIPPLRPIPPSKRGRVVYCGWARHAQMFPDFDKPIAWSHHYIQNFTSNDILVYSKNQHKKKDPPCDGFNSANPQDLLDVFPGKILYVNGESYTVALEPLRPVHTQTDRIFQIGAFSSDPPRTLRDASIARNSMVVTYMTLYHMHRLTHHRDSFLRVLLKDGPSSGLRPVNKGLYPDGVAYFTSKCVADRQAAARNISDILTVHYGNGCAVDPIYNNGTRVEQPQMNSINYNNNNNNYSSTMTMMMTDSNNTTSHQTLNGTLIRYPSGGGTMHVASQSREAFKENYILYNDYAFCLVMENKASPGYVTEKIFNAYLGGCLPIYYGTKEIFNIFHPESFIFYDVYDPQPALDLIRRLRDDPNEYYRRLRDAPILRDGRNTIEEYFSILPSIGNGTLNCRMRAMMGLPPLKKDRYRPCARSGRWVPEQKLDRTGGDDFDQMDTYLDRSTTANTSSSSTSDWNARILEVQQKIDAALRKREEKKKLKPKTQKKMKNGTVGLNGTADIVNSTDSSLSTTTTTKAVARDAGFKAMADLLKTALEESMSKLQQNFTNADGQQITVSNSTTVTDESGGDSAKKKKTTTTTSSTSSNKSLAESSNKGEASESIISQSSKLDGLDETPKNKPKTNTKKTTKTKDKKPNNGSKATVPETIFNGTATTSTKKKTTKTKDKKPNNGSNATVPETIFNGTATTSTKKTTKTKEKKPNNGSNVTVPETIFNGTATTSSSTSALVATKRHVEEENVLLNAAYVEATKKLDLAAKLLLRRKDK